MALKVRVDLNQSMICMAFLPKGSDWVWWRPAPKPSREQANKRTTTLGMQDPPCGDRAMNGVDRELLVARRAVHPRDLDVVQPEVDAEDRAVVDDVAQDGGPDHGRARHREERIAALQ